MKKNSKGLFDPKTTNLDFSNDPIDLSGDMLPAKTTSEGSSKLTRAQKVAMAQTQNNSQPSTPSPVTPPQPMQKAESSFDLSKMLLGATPILAGYLAGNSQAGFQNSAGAYKDLHAEEMALNKLKIASLKDKSEKSKRGRYQLKPYEDAEGITRMASFDTAENIFATDPNDPIAGYRQTLTKDPTTQELIKHTGAGNIKNVRGVDPRKYSVKQQTELKELSKTLLADEKFKVARSTVSATGRALALLQARNPINDAGIKTIFPRMFGEVGNLAAAEQERFGGSPAIGRKFEALKSKFYNGTLTDDDRADLMEVAQVMEKFAQHNLRQSASAHMDSFRKTRGYDPSEAIKPFINETSLNPKTAVKRAREADPRRGQPAYKSQIRNGIRFIYKLNATGGYDPHSQERVKKDRR